MPKNTEIPVDSRENAKVRIYSRDHTCQILQMFPTGCPGTYGTQICSVLSISVQIWGISITSIEST